MENDQTQPINPGPVNDDTGAGSTAGQAAISDDILRASNAAVEQHLAEQPAPKRGRGRPIEHGRYSAKKIPVGTVGNGPGKIPVAENPPLNNPFQPVDHAATVAPCVDEESVKAFLDGLISSADDIAQGIMRSYALTQTRDPIFAAQAGKEAAIGEKSALMIKAGGLGCWRKYASNFQYIPETAFFGGIAFWVGGLLIKGRHIRAKAEELKLPPKNPA